jgi:hypothetical protein
VLLNAASRRSSLAALPAILLLSTISALSASACPETADGVVRAVLFSSPTCPHCRKVREEVLPPLWERFGTRFQVAVLSTAAAPGRDLYWAAHRHFGVQQRGVPLLVLGDFALVGSDEIPRRLPGLVSSYLAAGGVDWPPLPGLDSVIAASSPAAAPTPLPTPLGPPSSTLAQLAQAAPLPPAAAEAASAGGPQHPPAQPAPDPASATAEPAAAAARGHGTSSRRSAGGGQPSDAARAGHRGERARDRRCARGLAPRHHGAGLRHRGAFAATIALLRALARRRRRRRGSERGGGPRPRDPCGNGLAILVLAGMVVVVARSVVLLRRPPCGSGRAARGRPLVRAAGAAPCTSPLDWLRPLLGLAGLGVAAYLAHVEARGVDAVCGPAGDCNTVQQSAYTRLFGVLPIGVLGLAGFAAILLTWVVRRWGRGRLRSGPRSPRWR